MPAVMLSTTGISWRASRRMSTKTQTGQARFQRAERLQIEWRPLSLDQLLAEDHTARLVWAYVESLDLTELYAKIRAVFGTTGRNPIDPKILLALWLMATIDGIGSARRLDRLCKKQISYQWLLGGVSVNYHTLADFRVDHAEFLDGLLTQSVAVLLHQGLIELTRIARDADAFALGRVEIRRRKPTLDQCLEEAERHLEELKQEAEEDASAEDHRAEGGEGTRRKERRDRLKKALEEREHWFPSWNAARKVRANRHGHR